VLSRVFSVEGRGRDMLAAAQQLDLEGIVAKRKADPYGPETTWFKIKNRAYTRPKLGGSYFRRAEPVPPQG
jgi:ATP-dependent DNA ligase